MKEKKEGTKSSKFPWRPLSVYFGSMKQKNIAESKRLKATILLCCTSMKQNYSNSNWDYGMRWYVPTS
jgi:hypothetical protein